MNWMIKDHPIVSSRMAHPSGRDRAIHAKALRMALKDRPIDTLHHADGLKRSLYLYLYNS